MADKNNIDIPLAWYPYCGIKRGWCLKDSKCTENYNNIFDVKEIQCICEYFSEYHPNTKLKPNEAIEE